MTRTKKKESHISYNEPGLKDLVGIILIFLSPKKVCLITLLLSCKTGTNSGVARGRTSLPSCAIGYKMINVLVLDVL